MNESWSSDTKWMVTGTDLAKGKDESVVLGIDPNGDIYFLEETVKETAIDLIKQQPFF